MRTPEGLRTLEMLGVVVGFLGCNEGALVTLGHQGSQAAPSLGRFGEPTRVAELSTDAKDDNPTLTADQLEIFFASTRDGAEDSGDVWTAVRTAIDQPFGDPQPVTAVNTEDFESSPAIGADGLTLWLGSDRDGGQGEVDIWQTTRSSRSAAWTEPVAVVELNSEQSDIPRPLGLNETIMPLGSRRSDEDNPYRTFFATRSPTTQQFEEPALVEELAHDDRTTVDAFLTGDGLLMLFSSSGEDESADLFWTRRATTSDAFQEPVPIDELNTDDDERDPWLSPDGTTLWFSSNRGDSLDLYMVTVEPD